MFVSLLLVYYVCCFFFFKQKTAYEMRISDWSSDVCSSDLAEDLARPAGFDPRRAGADRREEHRLQPLELGRHRAESVLVPRSGNGDGVGRLSRRHPQGGLVDRKSTRLNSSHECASRMPSSH